MTRSRSASLAAVALAAAPALALAQGGAMVRDHYANLEDCIADWGRAEHCERVRSSGYDGGMIVFRGLAYPPGAREVYRRDALLEGRRSGPAVSPDPAREGRSLGSVLEPPPLRRPVPQEEDPDEAAEDAPKSVDDTLAGLPYFLAYFGIALMMLTLALALHAALTRGQAIRRVVEGNAAASAVLAGVLTGFALPLAAAIARSETLLDMLVWGGSALLVQLLVYAGIGLTMSAVAQQVRAGQVAGGVFLGTLAAVLGLLNAAALSVAL